MSDPRLVRAPEPIPADPGPILFLAGAIDRGPGPTWRQRLLARLSPGGFTALDPTRDDWDDSWREGLDDDRYRRQVEWELAGLERADVVAMHVLPEGRAPATLVEFGLVARSGRLVVLCPAGFWRRGQWEVVAARYGAPLFDAWEPFVAEVAARLVRAVP